MKTWLAKSVEVVDNGVKVQWQKIPMHTEKDKVDYLYREYSSIKEFVDYFTYNESEWAVIGLPGNKRRNRWIHEL